jgi:ssDNA-binding Zn-finger/Zn-ribbon topoisomerase 1
MTDRIDINCPECLNSGFGPRPMVVRTNRSNGSEFLGCARWPECQRTEKLPEWVIMERAGQARLPGW